MKTRHHNRRRFIANVEQVESRCLLSAAPHYTIQDIGPNSTPILPDAILEPFTLVPGETSYGYASNSSGQITGNSSIVRYSISHAFFYSNGTISDITPNAVQAAGFSINDSGQVAGYETLLNGYNQAFVTGPNGIGLTVIGGPNVPLSRAYHINSDGDVVGVSSIPGLGSRGFLYKDGVFYDLNDLLTQSFQWKILGDHIAQAYSINDNGQILALDNGNERYLLTPIPQPISPTITWSNPADIVYGTPLSSTQLDATASVPGTFTYTPAAGTVLHAGAAQTLSATFIPNDTADYTTVTTTASINVLQAPLTITANDTTKVYGDSMPSLAVSYNGFVNGDTVASLTSPATATTSATSASPVGSYAITPSGAIVPDYAITYVNGTLAITPAHLTIKADNAYSQIGFPIPPLTGTITGLVNGDTDIATYTTTATQSSYIGNYPIVPHLADPNYNITIVNGTLTIGYYPFPWPPF